MRDSLCFPADREGGAALRYPQVKGSREMEADRNRPLPRVVLRGIGARLGLTLALTLAAMGLLVTVTWQSTVRLIEEFRQVERSKEILVEARQAYSAVAEADAGHLGYLLTGDPEYLATYKGADARVHLGLSRIAALVADDPKQGVRVQELQRFTEQRFALMELTVRLFGAGRREEAIFHARSGDGKRTTDVIRRLVVDLEEGEKARLLLGKGRTQQSIRAVAGTLGIGATLLFGLLFLSWYVVRADLARRDVAQAALREKESRIRRLVDSNLVGVLFSDRDGLLEANDAFLSLIGFDRDVWKPHEHRLFEFTAPEYRGLDATCDEEVRTVGSCRPYQKELIRRDGTRVPVLFGAAAVDTAAEKPVLASFAIDLSELKRVEAERNRLYEEARAAVEARDAFLSVAGHEIRTPLSALNLLVYQLARHVSRLGDGKTSGLVGRCEKQVERLIRLTDELLDVSRITDGTIHLDLDEMDLSALARDVTDRFEESARRAKCSLTVIAPAPVLGFWDRSRLDQVATNLLTNALKFGPGKPIVISVHAEGDEAVLSVKDEGLGIQPEDQARIFQKFERAAPSSSYRGFGLGLWIVSRMVEAHGGTIRVESRPGAGATFRVILPRPSDGDA